MIALYHDLGMASTRSGIFLAGSPAPPSQKYVREHKVCIVFKTGRGIMRPNLVERNVGFRVSQWR